MGEEITVIRYAAHPQGAPGPGTFQVDTAPAPEPAEGEVLVRPVYLTMDPYLRIRMRGDASFDGGPIMGGPLTPGRRVPGRGSGIVEASRHDGFAPGDRVTGELGWASRSAVPGAGLVKLPPTPGALRLSQSLLGGTGMSAYFALLDTGQPAAGETVLITGAAGGVGSIAVQLARIRGCRVVGVAGGPEKCGFVRDALAAEACVDHRAGDIGAALDAACPDGIDVFLDGVGGALHDAAMARMREKGRVVQLGAISRYGGGDADLGPRNLYRIAIRRLRIQGFLVADHIPRFDEARGAMMGWLQEGRLRPVDTVREGLANAPGAFAELFGGEATGKLLLRVSPDPDETPEESADA